jgi:adenylosuccinate lyase
VATRMSDSIMYRHLWTSSDLDYLFEERGRLATWLDILVALAWAQAELGIIPTTSAASIAQSANVDQLDIEFIAEHTRSTSHSTLGLIRGLKEVLPAHAHEHIYYGTTVQDVTDTWFGIVMRDVGDAVDRRSSTIENLLVELAHTHRDTVMVGRTHGQPGAPITFGMKVATWADEVRRHRDRLREGRSRWAVGQLSGAVGVLGFFEPVGIELRRRLCDKLGLADPGMSWTTSRDRLAEFGHTLSMLCATLARIGGEVYELQRPEIGELREPANVHGVGSITMPHKRNPESSEHLATLARLVRAHSGTLLEGMDQQHERDGRGWKAEWIALPEICELTVVGLTTAERLLSGLEVDSSAMARNLASHGPLLRSEQILVGLAERIGKHQAQDVLQQALEANGEPRTELASALAEHGVSAEDLDEWLTRPAVGASGQLVDAVVDRARRALSIEDH